MQSIVTIVMIHLYTTCLQREAARARAGDFILYSVKDELDAST